MSLLQQGVVKPYTGGTSFRALVAIQSGAAAFCFILLGARTGPLQDCIECGVRHTQQPNAVLFSVLA